MSLIFTENLTKEYKIKGKIMKAINNLNIKCEKGQIYSLLGPNGAGKTTTLRILTTLINPTSGDAFINNQSVKNNPERVRKYIGYVSYETRPEPFLTPKEIAYYFGRINNVNNNLIRDRIKYFSKLFNMDNFLNIQTHKLSTGMKQKTTILRALIQDPEILILDEPTAGLDILTAKTITDYLKLLKNEGKAIIFSTHILWEAEKISDKIGIIHKGNLLAEGTLDSLQKQFNKTDIEDIFFDIVKEEENC